MKKKLLLIYVLVLPFLLSSQNETQYWYFGQNAGLSFATSPPTILTNGMLNTNEGCATLSDAAGNLLLYTDGSTVYNNTHVAMANGTGLTGNSSTTQSAIIIKRPGSSSIFYVFTLGASGTGSLCFSTVDLTLAAGLGSVTVKNTLLSPLMTERLTSVRHCNGTDIWVLAHENNSDKFNAYLVTTTGVNTTPVQTAIGTLQGPGTSWLGNMKASPGGKKLGLAIHGTPGAFELYDFDNATGVVSNSLSLGAYANAYGCEFSPDGSKFYGDRENNSNGPTLYQWDVCAGSPTAVVASLYTVTVPSHIMGMQSAKDGKIYVARSGALELSVINNPNNSGVACNYMHASQSVAPKHSSLNLPNFMTSYFKPAPLPFTYSLTCAEVNFMSPSSTSTVGTGCSVFSNTITGQQWNFGDPSSGTSNISALANPSHAFSNPGTYTVQLILYTACSADTLRQVVNVANATSPLTITGNLSLCKGETIVLTASGATNYTWSTGAHTSTIALSPSNSSVYSLLGTTGICKTSKVFTVTVSPCTGIAESGENGNFSIYPNPSEGTLFVETTNDIKIRMLDKTGVVVLETSVNAGKHALDIRNLSNGIYTIQCITQKTVITKSLVKID